MSADPPGGSDPLARYRRPGAAPAAPAAPRYAAFGTKEHPPRVDVRPREGPARAFAYAHITEILHDREGSAIALVTPGRLVKLQGCHLHPVAEALIAQNCSFVEEHDPAGPPADSGAPVIEQVEIFQPKSAG